MAPKGIFTIETKTFSKPANGQAHIDFNGTTLTANGYRPDRNPITQSLAQANWLSELIKESTGHQHSVKPVVVFPGWFIRTSPEAKSNNVWVLNPKGLPKYLDNAAPKLSPEEVQLVAYHLSRYIRTHTPSL
ncbi:MAG: nuclease-related domain-containing protein [Cyanobacteria bacterium J06553_1]